MSKQSKNKSKSAQGSSSIYGQPEKGLSAVLVADLLNERFEPLNHFIPPCLLPLNDVPLLHITLSILIADGFKHILIYASKSYQFVKEFVSNLPYVQTKSNGVNVVVKNVEKCRNLGDIMRDLESCEFMSGVLEFLLAPADLICAVSLSNLMKKYKDRQTNCPHSIMTLLLPQVTPALSPIQVTEFKVSVIYNQSEQNCLINYFRGAQDECYPIFLGDIMRTAGQVIQASADLMDIQLYICTRHIPALFELNPDDQNQTESNQLWQTAWDRMKQMAKVRRRYLSNSCSLSRFQSDNQQPFTNMDSKCDGDDDDLDNETDDRDEGEQSEVFLIGEFKRTLERSQSHNYPLETIVLEINSLKHAYNISIEDLCFLLTKSLLDLVTNQLSSSSSSSSSDLTEFVQLFRDIFAKFRKVFHHCTTMVGCHSSAGRLYLQAVEDTACYNELILNGIQYIIHGLYDEGLVAEDDIWWWRDQSPLLSDEELNEKTQNIRMKLGTFFKWLEEAEEEDEE